GAYAPRTPKRRLVAVFETFQIDAQLGQGIRGGVLDELDLLFILVEHFHVQAEALELLDEHLEGFGHARLLNALALDDGLVGLDATDDVVRLDGEQLLEDVGGAVRFERPHLHLTEALATELGLTT